jgi:hypothetical protein
VGDRARQSREAKREELDRVVKMAHVDADARRREVLRGESVGAILVELAVESLRLARTFVLAPFRIAAAVRRARAVARA